VSATGLQRASVAAFAVLVVVLVALYRLGALLGGSAPALVLQALAFLLMVWARVAFGRRSFHAGADPTAGGLVTSGPYRFVRHPIYSAVLGFLLVGVVARPSLAAAGLFAVAVGAVFVRITAEETLVRARYPEYERYAARTKRLVPFVL